MMGVKCQHEIIRCLKAFMNNKVSKLNQNITLFLIFISNTTSYTIIPIIFSFLYPF